MSTLKIPDAVVPVEAPAARSGLAARTWRTVRSSRAATIGLAIVAVHVLIALLAPVLTSYEPTVGDATHALLGPGADHWAGTDQYGRDVLARVLYGGRYALGVSVAATVLTIALGTVLGCAAALRGGWLDDVLMRVLDAVLSIPSILALLVVVTALGTGPAVIVLAIAVVYVPQVVRVVRGAALAVVPADYVTAARARGERTWSILWREVLPNITDVVCVEFAMRASWVVLLISSLSFLGFGANPPTPDWGLMVAENRTAITVVPMASLAPIIALATLVIGLNLAADGLSKAWGVDRIREGS
ncbi:oligopeptide ABC transporter, permease [Streptomyces bingchenggensis BCW-1]|uniref:Oligopeptide ABC transporter, permease n=1 Tax=Streptomyces bingchenggensis (strain BCW-1) TaxID=749414 RepID=D7BS19_STRBB|nr:MULTISPECIES: ABC transporter permease [Streptomyces]ADI07356.1 oligopeptide ABC transporter, permease [Streptomyces bingchenggensis BCW-1]